MSAYNADMPWESVFREAAINVEFWLRELQEPAMLYSSTRGETAPSWTSQRQDQQQHLQGQKRDSSALEGNLSAFSQGVCNNYNLGKCTFKGCRRPHVCSVCHGNHPSFQCDKSSSSTTRADKGKGKGKGKQYKKKKGEKGAGK